jgi:lambda repressor-like predicted transcriptional regulator
LVIKKVLTLSIQVSKLEPVLPKKVSTWMDDYSYKLPVTPLEAGGWTPLFISTVAPVDEPTRPNSRPNTSDDIDVSPCPPPSEIKRALKKRGFSLGDIAQRTGYSRAYTGRVIKGERHCPKIARLVAEILGVTPTWLWPDYQDSPYKRGPRPRRAHRSFARVMQARHELKKNLKQWDVTITRLAQIVKRSRSTVSAVINRIATAAPTALAIIHALFDRRQEKFFEAYFPDYAPPKSYSCPHFLTLFDTGRQRLKAGAF